MRLSSIFTLLTVSLVLPVLSKAAETPIPQAFPTDRYQRIWTKSPFTVSSVVAAAPAAEAGFADSLTLVGLATVNNKPVVTVRDNTSQQSQMVTSEANAEGISVVSLKNDLDPSKVEVVLKKGEQTGTLKFNTASFAVNTAAPTVQNPAQPNVNRGNIPPPTMPSTVRIQNPNGAVPAPNVRRRIRQIPLPGADRRTRQNGSGIIPPPSPR